MGRVCETTSMILVQNQNFKNIIIFFLSYNNDMTWFHSFRQTRSKHLFTHYDVFTRTFDKKSKQLR